MIGERRDRQADPARIERRATTCAGCGRSVHEVRNLYVVGAVMGCRECIRTHRMPGEERPRAVARVKRAAKAA